MKKYIGQKTMQVLSAFFVLCLPLAVQALTIEAFEVNDLDTFQADTNISAWLAGGSFNLIEDFEGNELTGDWVSELSTAVGSFEATGSAGTGATSSPDSNPNTFRVVSSSSNYYGRFNTTPDGSRFLDSADITEITLTLADGLNVSKMFFFLTDPSDVGATTSIASESMSKEITPKQDNKSLWFVGIDAGDDYISKIIWSTDGHTNDGFGLDDFTQVVAVPEPGTLLLLGSGLAGLALYRRRSMNK